MLALVVGTIIWQANETSRRETERVAVQAKLDTDRDKKLAEMQSLVEKLVGKYS